MKGRQSKLLVTDESQRNCEIFFYVHNINRAMFNAYVIVTLEDGEKSEDTVQ